MLLDFKTTHYGLDFLMLKTSVRCLGSSLLAPIMQDIVWKRTLDALDRLLIANFKLVALKLK